MATIFQILNGDEIALSLQGLGSAARKVARQALRTGTAPMVAAIRGHIHDVSGGLGSGLRARPGRGDRPGRFSMLIASLTTREKYSRTRSGGVAARVRKLGGAKDKYRNWYDLSVEGGHANARGGGRTPAHPFMRPGFDETEEATAELVETALGEGIEAAL